MFIKLSKNYFFFSFFFLAILFLVAFSVSADETLPGYLGQSKSAEASLGGIGKKVVEWILYLAVVLSSIASAAGLAMINGLIGNKEKGMDMIKTGLSVMAISGVALGIFAFFAGLGH